MSGYLEEYLRPLAPLLDDPAVIEIAINADGRIWVEGAGNAHMQASELARWSPGAIRDLAGQIANTAGEKLTDRDPNVSTSIRYAHIDLRAQAMIAPAVMGGAAITLRAFRSQQALEHPHNFRFLREPKRSLEEERREKLAGIMAGAADKDVDAFLKLIVAEHMNIIVSGGTSTGKTALGRRLLSLVDPAERIVTIEDSAELLPNLPNVVSLIASRDTASSCSADALLQGTLRLRPDRIILGELRGKEAATFLDAINTGHAGSFTTIHAETARKAMERLALLVMATGTRLSFEDVIRYLGNSIDVIIQMGRLGDQRGILEVFMPGQS
ncbi:MAG: ATPase, T2SS/T4P/T4SS family, partial [Albidovulum sp.]